MRSCMPCASEPGCQSATLPLRFTFRRGSGKRVLLRDLLFRFHDAGVPRVCVSSSTEHADGYFAGFIPAASIHGPISIEALDAVWRGQRELVIRKASGQIPPDADIRLIVVLEDVDREVLACRSLQEMFINGRNVHVIVIVTLQDLTRLSDALRSNTEVIFVRREDSAENRERLYTQMASFVPGVRAFDRVLAECEDHQSLVITPVVPVSDPTAEDMVSLYTSDAPPDFRFGNSPLR